MHDLIILGAGPAGITAAVYAARKKLDTLVVTKDIGGMAAWSADIENYTGFQFITGPELAEKFEEHIEKYDEIEVLEEEEADCINQHEESFSIETKKGDKHEGRAVIIATGRRPKGLGIPGEKEYMNKGVTYCATCDAPLFADKDVAVVGGGNSALDAALQLKPIADKIYLLTINDELDGDKVLMDKVKDTENIQILYNADTKEIMGDQFVDSMRIEQDGEEKTLEVQGVFIEIGALPVNEPAECEGLKLNEDNEIVVNPRCETNIDGLYAAGDVTDVPEKQIIVAAGQGCIASLSAYRYLSKKQS